MVIQELVKFVLLPALDGTGKLFSPFLRCLSSSIVPVIISYPTHQIMTLDEMAEWVESQLPMGQFALLVESFSGLVALRLLPKVSSRLSCVIFVGTFVSLSWPSLLDVVSRYPFLVCGVALLPNWFIRLFCLGREASNGQCTWFRSVLLEVHGKVIAHRLALISKAYCFEPFAIQCPCYYIQAIDDRLVPKTASSWFEKNMSGLRVLPLQAPHCMLQAKPVESAKLVEKCLLTNT